MGPILGIPEKEERGVWNVPSRPPASFTRTPLSMNFPRSSTVSFLPLMVVQARGIVGRNGAPLAISQNSVGHVLAGCKFKRPKRFFPLEEGRVMRRGGRRRRPNAEAVTAPEPSKAEMGFVQVTASAQWRGTRADPVRAEVTRTDVSCLGLYD